jgi:hypothetical protein
MTTDRKIRQDRLKHTHLQFLKAEEQYPTLYNVAINPIDDKDWSICALGWRNANPLLIKQGICLECYEEYYEFMDKHENAHIALWNVAISTSRFRTKHNLALTKFPLISAEAVRPLQHPFVPGVFQIFTKKQYWASRYLDPNFDGANDNGILTAIEVFERMGEEMFRDYPNIPRDLKQDINGLPQSRNWLMFLYDIFAPEPEIVCKTNIIGLPWNVFSTSARAIEYLLESPQKEKKSGNCRYRPPLCKSCGGKTKVLSKQGKTRYLECRECRRKASISE